MSRKPRTPRMPGRPSLGDKARNVSVVIRLTKREHAAVRKLIRLTNAEAPDGPQLTVSAFFRNIPLGMIYKKGPC